MDDTHTAETGHDTITDFDAASDDVIELAGLLLNRSADIFAGATQVGDDVLITFDDENSLRLLNIELDHLEHTDGTIYGTAEIDVPSGDDTIFGTSNDDTYNGGAGNDYIHGKKGDDLIDGGDGFDRLIGGEGHDTLNGGADNDFINGKKNDDLIDGGNGDDDVRGANGHDTLSGGDGTDTLSGGAGNDQMSGGAGDDILTGDGGADVFIFASNSGNDTVTDFDASEGDVLDVSATSPGFGNIDQLADSAIDTADGLLIDLGGGNSVTLTGVSVADLLSAPDNSFIF